VVDHPAEWNQGDEAATVGLEAVGAKRQAWRRVHPVRQLLEPSLDPGGAQEHGNALDRFGPHTENDTRNRSATYAV
jgi:hypothetical protein